jgi:two-component system, sensor histidine kinase and response regulator
LEETVAKRILAIDDDEGILELEKAILREGGFEVATARSAEDALVLMRGQSFDLVLLDVVMPEMDGFTFCRTIKEDPALKSTPVVFLTAKGGGEALAEGYESGGFMYIAKPFSNAKLLAVVNMAIEAAAGEPTR